MSRKKERALLNDRLVSRICAAVVEKLEQDFFSSVPSKQRVVGSNPPGDARYNSRLDR